MNPIAQLLVDSLEKRKIKNKNYSMRAFARVLDLEPSALSKIMKSQRIPNCKTFLKIAGKLELDSEEQKRIIEWIEKANRPVSEFVSFQPDYFENDIELYHIFILEALRIPLYANSIDKLKRALGMDEKRFTQALLELEKMNMLSYERETDQVKVLSCHNSTLPVSRTTEKMREIQKKCLQMAVQAVDEVPIECRDNSTLTVAISQDQLAYFKNFILKVRRKINLESEKNIEKANVVYNFTFAVYPVIK